MARHFHPLKIVMAYRLGQGYFDLPVHYQHSVMELKLVQCPIAQRYGTGNRARRGEE